VKHGKVDANQKEIVDGLRQVGASVVSLADVGKGTPDILVGFRQKSYLLEIKTDDGKLTPDQRLFHATWNGHIAIVRNLDEALRVIGAI